MTHRTLPKFELRTCAQEHIRRITPAASQVDDVAYVCADPSQVLNLGFAMSAWRGDYCLGAGGLIKHWPGRAEAWLLVDEGAGPDARRLLRSMRFVLDSYPCRRVEMTVLADNVAGHRIASLLGFEREATLRAYHVNGRDVVMYARIKQ